MNKVVKWTKMYVGRKAMKVNRDKLLKTINEKRKKKNCPMCGNNDWTIDNNMRAMVGIDENKSIQLGGQIIPVVTITCRECGNTILVNPLIINCTEE